MDVEPPDAPKVAHEDLKSNNSLTMEEKNKFTHKICGLILLVYVIDVSYEAYHSISISGALVNWNFLYKSPVLFPLSCFEKNSLKDVHTNVWMQKMPGEDLIPMPQLDFHTLTNVKSIFK